MAQSRVVGSPKHPSAVTTAIPDTHELEPGVPIPVDAERNSPGSPREIAGMVLDGKYRVEDLIGRGGMARVYRAMHVGLQTPVAIKVLNTSLRDNEQAALRFEREAYAASRLHHANCLQVTDFGRTSEGLLYMVMEFLEGKDLSEYMGRPMHPQRAAMLMVQILRGLQHAHERGLVHRDLKPHNVFVTHDQEGRQVLKLVDFGLAKILHSNTVDPNFTQMGMIFGTPLYMSPEQAIGRNDIDGRSDLYSAGGIFYQLLTGRPPFTAPEPVALLHQHVAAPVPELPRNVPKTIRRVVHTLLSKHRDHRFENAGEVLDILNPRRGQRVPRVPDPVRRRKTMPPTDPAGIELAKSLQRAASHPEILRLDGTTETPVPAVSEAALAPGGPALQLATREMPVANVPYSRGGSREWVAPVAVFGVAAAAWATRRLWLDGADLPVVSLAGLEMQASHLSTGFWSVTAVLALLAWLRARG